MYSRNFGGIETDGQLLKIQKEREKEFIENYAPPKIEEEKPAVEACENKPLSFLTKQGGILGGILNNWSIDDLILIGLTIYLLTDNNHDNDIFVILLVLLLT